jgi:CheY-like chemotaxis protein
VTRHLKQIAAGGADAALTFSRLPPPDTSRWVARRKAEVVDAIRAGRLSIEEACRRYRLTVEELAGWQRAFFRYGLAGLKVSRHRIEQARTGERQRHGRRSAAREAPARPGRRPAGGEAGPSPRRPGPLRLLVIDDEPMIARFVAYTAEAHGIETAMTISADRFRRDYDEHDPDIVVLDLAMPGGDGIELLRFLAGRGSRARIVMLSGFDERVLDAAVRLGRSVGLRMAAPLAKPVTVDDLLAAIEGAGTEAES